LSGNRTLRQAVRADDPDLSLVAEIAIAFNRAAIGGLPAKARDFIL